MNIDNKFHERFIDSGAVYQSLEKVCMKKCIENIAQPQLNPGQQDCLYRCAFKFKEALEFGFDTITYQNHHIHKYQSEEPVNMFGKQSPVTVSVSGMNI